MTEAPPFEPNVGTPPQQPRAWQSWMDNPTTMRQLRRLREAKVTPRCPTCGGWDRVQKRVGEYGVYHTCCGNASWNYKPLVSQATLNARKAAHATFDPLWQVRKWNRNHCYLRLAAILGIDRKQCHMALMDEATARRVPEAVEQMIREGVP